MMKSWQKYSVLGATLFVVGGLGGLGTYALMHDSDTAVQAFEQADLNVSLNQTFKFPNTQVLSNNTSVVNGTLSVKNTGTQNALVRVAANVSMSVPGEGGVPIQVPMKVASGDVFSWTLGDKWLDGGDGYFYYLEAVAPGKETAPAVTKATFGAYSLIEELAGWTSSSKHEVNLTPLFKAESASVKNGDVVNAFWQGVTPTSGNAKTIYDTYQTLIKK